MTRWPDSDGAAFRQYVYGLTLRTPLAARVYRCILRGFQQFVSDHHPECPVSVASVTDWLQDRILVWPLHLVTHRARLVDRFLDWLVAGGCIVDNPLAGLRAEYRQHSTAPIVRALASPDPRGALEELRTLPPFGSHLGPAMLEHISVMRAAGFRYSDYENRLLALDRFLQGQSDVANQPFAILIQRWAQEAPRLELRQARIRVGRVVARALQRKDPSVIAPMLDRQLEREVRRRQRRPHIFSAEEIQKLFKTALALPSPRAPLRPHTLHTMLVLAYCAGLRLGEIARLTIGDIRMEEGVIEIRETKFFKTRHLPLSPSAVAALRSYLVARKQAGGPSDDPSALFWQEQDRCGYARMTVEGLLARVFRSAGLKPPRPNGRVGPRIHDLRHTFVVHRMTEWYRAGINPEPMLPYLATYLGHKNIHSTLVYLTVTQELLQHANQRFRLLGGPSPSVTGKGWFIAMTDTLPNLLQRFFHQWLAEQRNASRHTILAYRDAWRLFLRFVADRTCRPVAKLTLNHLTAAEVAAFLQHVETGRGASIATRNCRLAALKSFFLFVADREPSAAGLCAEVLHIPSKKKAKRAICYLEQEEVAAILAQPDQSTLLGQRDHTLLGFLYNTGARIQEALDVCPKHLRLDSPAHVLLFGKGRKERICPLWPETAGLIVAHLRRQPRTPDEPIFCNRYGHKLGASGVRFQLHQYVNSASEKMPNLSAKRISPHTFRHTTAVHLIASGVDVTVIRSWLGHAQLDTTNHYAQANLQTKREALEHVASRARPSKPPRWKRDQDLLAWLDSL